MVLKKRRSASASLHNSVHLHACMSSSVGGTTFKQLWNSGCASHFDAVVHTGRSTAVNIETFSKKSGLVTHVTPPCRPAVATCGGKSAEREVTISQGRTHETARAADGTGRDDVTHVQQRNGRWMYDTSTARSYLHYSVEDSPYKLCHRV